jgi:hypothetical protein
MRESVRIVHASHLRLDQPVVGLRRLGQIPRETIRDCTLLALRRLVEQTREHEADLLLLTGPCWPEDGLGPRGAMALAEACRVLSQDRIPVVLSVVDRESVQEGFRSRGLPHNLHLLLMSSGQPLKVSGARGPAIELQVVSLNETVEEAPKVAGANLTRVGVALSGDRMLLSDAPLSIVGGPPLDDSLDYVATCEPARRRTLNVGGTIVHSPGPLQGLNAFEQGSCGATLVECRPEAEPRLEQLPISVFNWEQWGLEGIRGETRGKLVARMLESAERQMQDSPTTPRVLRWNLASDEWPEGLTGAADEMDALLDEVDSRAQRRGWQFASQSLLRIAPLQSGDEDPLLEEYSRLLSETTATARSGMYDWTAALAERCQCSRADLDRFLGRAALGRISREALTLGRQWLLERESQHP